MRSIDLYSSLKVDEVQSSPPLPQSFRRRGVKKAKTRNESRIQLRFYSRALPDCQTALSLPPGRLEDWKYSKLNQLTAFWKK